MKIVDKANEYFSSLTDSKKLLDCLNNDFTRILKEDITQEYSSDRAVKDMHNRLSPINILKMITDRLSEAYTDYNVSRESNNKDFIDHYTNKIDLNNNLIYLNQLLSLHGFACIQLFTNESNQADLRVLSALDIMPFSNSNISRNKPDSFAIYLENNSDNERVYQVYTKNEVIKVTEKNKIIDRKEHKLGLNPILFVTLNKNKLIPSPSIDLLSISLSVSKKLTDLNYASKYLSHSVLYSIDLDMGDEINVNADAFLQLKSEEEGKSGSIGSIKPSINISDTLKLIQEELSIFLRSKGITSAQAQSQASNSMASGISKSIDESDNQKVIRKYQELFKNTEKSLWQMIALFHNTFWVESNTEFNKGIVDLEVDINFEKINGRDTTEDNNQNT